jgi:UDPglucose--hexose-1-phosphate uridylyltransferase
MATVSFLWHLHQPAYRTADGVSHAPWVALHAGGAYTTLARAIEVTGGPGQVVNIVPTLLEQLLAYVDDAVTDPVVEAIVTPAADLTDCQREVLVDWAFHVNPRQLARYPRLGQLARSRSGAGSKRRRDGRFGTADLRDLQILFVLAQAGEQAWTDDRLEPLYHRGRNFRVADHRQMADWLQAQPGELVDLWRRIAAQPNVEVATSPYAHPIMPLLIDSGVVAASWAPHPAPQVPVFRHPEDARWQLARGLEFMTEHGFPTTGCWPPEGSVSEDAVAVFGDQGVQWLVSDEGILERSLDRSLREGNNVATELYRSWRLAAGGPTLFFRDRRLSDAIGFQYGRWDDEGEAAAALVGELQDLARTLPEEANIVIALDGENPWLYYPEGGGRFLRELMQRLADAPPELAPATLAAAAAGGEPAVLDRLHPGSWINSVFATWIGHPEKTHAWEVLTEVRDAIAKTGDGREPSLLLAEGSDWFWWLGDDNPTELAPLYDEIFRKHLADACNQAGIVPPFDLDAPLKFHGFSPPEGWSVSASALRRCPIKHIWTIIAPDREQPRSTDDSPGRPDSVSSENDPFAPGNEAQTPPEIYRVPSADGGDTWQVRVFADSSPILRVEGEVVREAVGLNDTVSGIGAHEIIVETPDTDVELADLDVEEILPILQTYRARLLDLRRDLRLRYVMIFKNKGREAGASVAHAHSQLIATPIIPTVVVRELNSAREHFNRNERCLFCDMLRQELRLGERICIETDRFLALAPFAATSPFETWILPREHHHDFALATDDELLGLAAILRDLLRRIRALLDDPAYNLVLHTAPSPHPRPGHPDYWSTLGHDYHWHFELVPRIIRTGGFEIGAGIAINPTPPEDAARMLREAGADSD